MGRQYCTQCGGFYSSSVGPLFLRTGKSGLWGLQVRVLVYTKTPWYYVSLRVDIW